MGATQKQQEENRVFWAQHQEQWEASGLTRRIYCDRQNLNFRTFIYWRNRLQKEKRQDPPVEGRLRLVSFEDQEARLIKPGPGIELRFPDCSVIIKAGVDRALLMLVINTLRQV